MGAFFVGTWKTKMNHSNKQNNSNAAPAKPSLYPVKVLKGYTREVDGVLVKAKTGSEINISKAEYDRLSKTNVVVRNDPMTPA